MEQYIAQNKDYKFPHYLNAILVALIVILFLILLCLLFVVSPMTIVGDSMQNTLIEGDHIFLLKVFYDYTYGDILIFKKDSLSDKKIIKRVIGMPGDYIRYDIIEKCWYRNDQKLIEDYVKCEYTDYYLDSSYIKSELTSEKGLLVEDNSLFILGDNRVVSNDSHIYGCISMDLIVGKYLFTY
ncbi:MAG: signal peptidase I [Christensenella sp.]|nr:signal peptidase I [Christensenella sp.]